ncbi:hypothetical protein QWZ13_15860 [Reinekea marina]|uniref:hypothetical protein n=1 Tax=Reinekea marina TaxID=1310421 RepID=UPI0025B463BA|nr:hypothetical protein [Reinekea marina]MDN3650383.1 hypothetical protein [Reinekea marina]
MRIAHREYSNDRLKHMFGALKCQVISRAFPQIMSLCAFVCRFLCRLLKSSHK